MVIHDAAALNAQLQPPGAQGKAQVDVFKSVAVRLVEAAAIGKLPFAQHNGRPGYGL